METRQLGPDGPMVSAIGLGSMSIAGFYGPTTEAEVMDLLARTAEMGIDHLDTANVYGKGASEEAIGRYLAQGGFRFRIATKAGIRTSEQGDRYYDNSPEHLTGSLEASLKRLGVERVDLFYVHRREADRPIEEVTETLEALRRSGKIAAFGFSEIAPDSLRRAAAVAPVAAVQSEYSLSSRAPDLGLVQACAELGTALVAFSPMGRGLLTDSPPDADRAAASAFLARNPRFQQPNLDRNLTWTAKFRALAAEMGEPAAALATAWLLSRDAGVIPIPGTRSPDHLAECARGADLRLSQADLDRIETVLPVGWAAGDRYSDAQWFGPEHYC